MSVTPTELSEIVSEKYLQIENGMFIKDEIPKLFLRCSKADREKCLWLVENIMKHHQVLTAKGDASHKKPQQNAQRAYQIMSQQRISGVLPSKFATLNSLSSKESEDDAAEALKEFAIIKASQQKKPIQTLQTDNIEFFHLAKQGKDYEITVRFTNPQFTISKQEVRDFLNAHAHTGFQLSVETRRTIVAMFEEHPKLVENYYQILVKDKRTAENQAKIDFCQTLLDAHAHSGRAISNQEFEDHFFPPPPQYVETSTYLKRLELPHNEEELTKSMEKFTSTNHAFFSEEYLEYQKRMFARMDRLKFELMRQQADAHSGKQPDERTRIRRERIHQELQRRQKQNELATLKAWEMEQQSNPGSPPSYFNAIIEQGDEEALDKVIESIEYYDDKLHVTFNYMSNHGRMFFEYDTLVSPYINCPSYDPMKLGCRLWNSYTFLGTHQCFHHDCPPANAHSGKEQPKGYLSSLNPLNTVHDIADQMLDKADILSTKMEEQTAIATQAANEIKEQLKETTQTLNDIKSNGIKVEHTLSPEAANASNGILTSIKEVITNMREKASGVNLMTQMETLVGLISGLYAIYESEKYSVKLAIATSMLALTHSATGIIDVLTTWNHASQWFNYILITPQAHTAPDDSANWNDHEETKKHTTNLFMEIVPMIRRAFGYTTDFQQKLDHKRITNLKSYVGLLKTTKDMLAFIFNLIKEACIWIYEMVTGTPYVIEDAQIIMNDISQWITDATNLLDQDVVGNTALNSKLITQVDDLLTKGHSYATIITRTRSLHAYLGAFLNVYNSMKNLHHDMLQFRRSAKPRIEPFFAMYYGPPGVGKTDITSIVAYEMWNTTHTKKEDQLNQGMIYYRKLSPTEQWWSGYHNQPITVWNDCWQVDIPEIRTLQGTEFILTKDTAPLKLEMPDLEGKTGVYFDSSIMLTSCNLDYLPSNVLIQDRNALLRRIDCLWYMTTHEMYAKMRDNLTASIATIPSHQKDSDGLPNKDEWIFFKTNPFTKHIDQTKKYTYFEMVQANLKRLAEIQQGATLLQARLDSTWSLWPDQSIKLRESWQKTTSDLQQAHMKRKEQEKDKPTPMESAIAHCGKENCPHLSKAQVSKELELPELTDEQYLQYCSIFDQSLGVQPPTLKVETDYAKRITTMEELRNRMLKLIEDSKQNIVVLKAQMKEFANRIALASMKQHPLKRAIILLGSASLITALFYKATSYYNTPTAHSYEGSKGPLGAALHRRVTQTLSPYVPNWVHANPQPEAHSGVDKTDLYTNTFAPNIFKFSTRSDDGDWHSHEALFISENIFITVLHQWEYLNHADHIIITWKDIKYKIPKTNIRVVKDEKLDLLFGEFYGIPSLPLARKIKHHFIVESDIAKLLGLYINLLKPNKTAVEIIAFQFPRWFGKSSYRLNDHSLASERTFRAIGNATGGWCGLPYCTNNSSFARSIIGIHVAGTASEVIGIIVTQTVLEAGVRELIKLRLAQTPQAHSGVPKLLPYDPEKALVKMVEPLGDNLSILGLTDTPVSASRPSKIKRSPIFGMISEPVQFPAVLTPKTQPDGTPVDPYWNAIQKENYNITGSCDEELLDLIVSELCDRQVEYTPARKLTLDEAINGIPGGTYLGPMRRDTSTGYPFCAQQRKNPGKGDFIVYDPETNHSTPTQELQDLVYTREDAYRNDEELPWFREGFSANLKDERLPMSKIYDVNTSQWIAIPRKMNSNPIDFSCLHRMYDGCYTDNTMVSHPWSHHALGIDPHGAEWKVLDLMLTSYDENPQVAAADLKSHDARAKKILGQKANVLCRSWYKKFDPDWTPEDDKVRLRIHAATNGSVQIVRNVVTETEQGTLSGTLDTTPRNGDELFIALVYALLITAAEAGIHLTVQEAVDIIIAQFFGDDHTAVWPPRIRKFFTMHNIKKVFWEHFGMIYTSTIKGAELEEFIDYVRVTFLGRQIVPRGGWVFAPLKLSVIDDSLNWMLDIKDFEDTCRNSLHEYWHHGPEVYYERRERLNNALISVGRQPMTLRWSTIAAQNFGLSRETWMDSILDPDVKEDLIAYAHSARDPNQAELEEFLNNTGIANVSATAQAVMAHNRQQRRIQFWSTKGNFCVSFIVGYLVTTALIYNGLTPLAHSGTEPKDTGTKQEMQTVTNPLATQTTTTVTFGDNVGTMTPGLTELDKPPNLHEGTDPYPDQGMKTALEREFQIGTIVWSGTAAEEDDVFNFSFPKDLYLIPFLKGKLDFFQFFRAGVEVSFRLNGTAFHYGLIQISYVPHYKPGLNLNYFENLVTASCLDTVLLSPNTNATPRIRIPYVAPSRYWNMKDDPALNADGFFGKVNGKVIVPLRLQGAMGTPSLTISVFAHFTDPEVAGLGLRSASSQEENAIAHSGKETTMKSELSSLSKKYSKLGKEAIKVTFASLGDMATDGLSSLFGSLTGALTDKPTSVQSTDKRLLTNNSGLALANGLDQCEMLAMIPENKVSNDYRVFGKKVDYNLFMNYKALPAIIAFGHWDGSVTEGTKVLTIPVTPTFVRARSTIDGAAFDVTPIANLATYFTYWTGSLKYHILFVTSKYTSGRVVVKWLPDPTFTGSIANNEFGNTVSHVIDITGDTDFSFTIPYLQNKSWQEVLNYVDATNVPTTTWPGYNGQWVLTVLNPLTVSDALSDARIYYTVWCSGGPDFRTARPNGFPVDYKDGTTAVPPILPFKRDNNNTSTKSEEEAQAHSGLDKTLNMRTLFETPFPSLIKSTSAIQQGVTMGEEVESWSQLLRRYTQVYTAGFSAQSTYSTSFDGYSPNIGDPWISYYWRAVRSFHYYRGSIRHKPTLNTYGSTLIEMFAANDCAQDLPQTSGSNGVHALRTDIRNWIEFQTPFYYDYDMMCQTQYTEEIANRPKGTFRFYNGSVAATFSASMDWWASVGDDWSFGWPSPPVIISIVIPPK